jgi:hypothetical protein
MEQQAASSKKQEAADADAEADDPPFHLISLSRFDRSLPW